MQNAHMQRKRIEHRWNEAGNVGSLPDTMCRQSSIRKHIFDVLMSAYDKQVERFGGEDNMPAVCYRDRGHKCVKPGEESVALLIQGKLKGLFGKAEQRIAEEVEKADVANDACPFIKAFYSLNGGSEVVSELLSRYVNPGRCADSQEIDGSHRTGLMVYASEGGIEGFRVLMRAPGARKLELQDVDGNTALLHSVDQYMGGSPDGTEMVRLLVECEEDSFLDLPNNEGDTALMVAVARNLPDSIAVLIRAGAACNVENNAGVSPMLLAKSLLLDEERKEREEEDPERKMKHSADCSIRATIVAQLEEAGGSCFLDQTRCSWYVPTPKGSVWISTMNVHKHAALF